MPDKKVIAVLGATGAQGGGLVRAILNDPNGGYAARVLTRDVNGAKAKEFARLGAEVVAVDIDNTESLKKAFSGAYGAFCVTFFWAHFSVEKEMAEVKAMAEAAKAAGLRHAIWSTLEDTRKWVPLSDNRMPTLHGKYKVPHFDGKGESNQYFTDAGVPTTFLLTSFYWDNFISFGMGPKKGPDGKLGFDVAIFTPTKGGPFPTIINPSFFMTPGVNFTNSSVVAANEIAATTTNSSARPRFNSTAPVDPESAAHSFTNLLARGYAIVTYRYTQCGEDNAGFRTNSFYPAYPGYDWGVLYGWAWGLSRVVDYLETQPFADTNQLIALGHSRLGKLVMVATAFDERISLGAPAGSSGAGTGAYRFCGPGRGGKEGIEDMTRKFPYYFVPRLAEFTGQMEKLPFDAHWFVALTAPRPWISIEGTDDQNCVPNAVKQTVLAARPVYEFLGVNTDRVGVNYEPHRHALTAEDWNAALDFADKNLRGMKVERSFDQFPPELAPTNPSAPK